MFQKSAIEGFITACIKGLTNKHYGTEYISAVQRNLTYWQSVVANRAGIPDTDDPWGNYVIVHASHHPSSGERTNIGCMIFDQLGNQVFRRMGPFDRAAYRGDINLNQYAGGESLIDYRKDMDLDDIKRALESMGHAMSSIQMTEPRMTRLSEECYESIYHNFVLGL